MIIFNSIRGAFSVGANQGLGFFGLDGAFGYLMNAFQDSTFLVTAENTIDYTKEFNNNKYISEYYASVNGGDPERLETILSGECTLHIQVSGSVSSATLYAYGSELTEAPGSGQYEIYAFGIGDGAWTQLDYSNDMILTLTPYDQTDVVSNFYVGISARALEDRQFPDINYVFEHD